MQETIEKTVFFPSDISAPMLETLCDFVKIQALLGAERGFSAPKKVQASISALKLRGF